MTARPVRGTKSLVGHSPTAMGVSPLAQRRPGLGEGQLSAETHKRSVL